MYKIRGFTIVELLIVIVVVGILAAISIVAYNGVSDRANDSAVQSDLRNIANKINMYKAETGKLPASTAELALLNLTVSGSAYDTNHGIHYNYDNPSSPSNLKVYNLLYCRSASSDNFTLVGGSKSGKAFQFADGSVDAFSGEVPGPAHIICEDSGILDATPGPSQRTWFLLDGEWQTFVSV